MSYLLSRRTINNQIWLYLHLQVTLKIGGAATVFFGTQVKIKCPVKR